MRIFYGIIDLILLFSSVLAKKFVSDNITEQVMINGNHKRQYWNLNDTNESIGLNLTYLGSESAWQNKLPTMMCFAWCNADMLDSAPTRNVANSAPHSHSTTKILQSLVIFLPLIKKGI